MVGSTWQAPNRSFSVCYLATYRVQNSILWFSIRVGIELQVFGKCWEQVAVHEEFAKLLYGERFREHLVHSAHLGFFHVFFFNVASDCDNLRLRFPPNALLREQPSYCLGGIVTIHEWHIAIHKYQLILIRITFGNRLPQFLHCLVPIVTLFGSFFVVLNSQDH